MRKFGSESAPLPPARGFLFFLSFPKTPEIPAGRQIMRFADTGGWTLDANAFSDSADALGEAEIGNGRPDIGMRDGMKGGSLFLNGYNGADKAVFSAAGTYSNAETGKVVFNSVSFYRGTIVFDLAEKKAGRLHADKRNRDEEFGIVRTVRRNKRFRIRSARTVGKLRRRRMERGFAIVRDGGQQCFRERLFRQTPRRNYRENHDIEIERHIRRFHKSLPVPEPSGIAATLGLAALAFAARKRREK